MKRKTFADLRNEETRIQGTKESTLKSQGIAQPVTTQMWGKPVVVRRDLQTEVGYVPKNTTGKIQKEVYNNPGNRLLGYTVQLQGNPNPVILKQSSIELARSVNHSQTTNFGYQSKLAKLTKQGAEKALKYIQEKHTKKFNIFKNSPKNTIVQKLRGAEHERLIKKHGKNYSAEGNSYEEAMRESRDNVFCFGNDTAKGLQVFGLGENNRRENEGARIASEPLLGCTVFSEGNKRGYAETSGLQMRGSKIDNFSEPVNFSSRYNMTPQKLKDKKIVGDIIFSKGVSPDIIDTICDEIYYLWLVTGITVDRVIYSTKGIDDVKRLEADRYEELTGKSYSSIHKDLRGSTGVSFYDPKFYPSSIYIYPGLIARFTSLNLVVAHEIAHILNKKYNITNKLFADKITKFIFDKSKEAGISPQQYISSQVSVYATKTYSELFSECFSQAVNNINSELIDEVIRLAKMIPGFKFFDREIKRYRRSLGTWAGNKLHLMWNRG